MRVHICVRQRRRVLWQLLQIAELYQSLLFTAGSGLVQFVSPFPHLSPAHCPKLWQQAVVAGVQVDTLPDQCAHGRGHDAEAIDAGLTQTDAGRETQVGRMKERR